MGEHMKWLGAASKAIGLSSRPRPYEDKENFAGFALSFPPDAAALVRQELGAARVVLEYGSGGSTFLALEQGVEFIFSVESDARWASRIESALAAHHAPGRFHIHHADIGPTGNWGLPKGNSAARRFPAYAAGPYDHPQFRHPDLILVDGRFRTACFITAMLRCTRPVRLLFDDYSDRPHYHWVEDFFTPSAHAGRMALFEITPRALPVDRLVDILSAYVDYR